MSNDMEIIRQIEQYLGIELEPLPLEKIVGYIKIGYALDEAGQVQGLNLSGRKIKDISFLRSLGELSGLTHFSLAYNQITDLTPLRGLKYLKKIYLQDNKITNLTPLNALINLEVIMLWGNQIKDLTPLRNLTNLKQLNLSENQITDLKPLRELANLPALYLDDNQITEITPIRELRNLTMLNLGINQITDLTPLRDLKHLKYLNLSENRIERLPSDIATWWPGMEWRWSEGFLGGLNLYGNPLTDPPVEIVNQGKAAIENYFAEIAKASVLFLESKLLLVGSGDVGKTSLMKKLKDPSFAVVPGKEYTTRGIDIQPWLLSCPFPDGLSHDVKIHFWDFGGQDILHATHQFFLTKRSLYLFVWDPRKEEESRSFDYWLNAVKLLGAGAPLIMVMNKADLRIKFIDELSFIEKFPFIVQFLQVSCVSGHHLPELTDALRTAFSKMPHLLDKLPKRWMEIRDELKARLENYLTLADYYAVCRRHRMEQDKALFLSDYLHDLGIILHFRQDPVLADTVILKPEWATGAVYALIDSLEIQRNKGRFQRAHLSRYWDRDKYPAEKHPQLLRLIEKFELCFNIVGTDDYILPELLPPLTGRFHGRICRRYLKLRIYRSAGDVIRNKRPRPGPGDEYNGFYPLTFAFASGNIILSYSLIFTLNFLGGNAGKA